MIVWNHSGKPIFISREAKGDPAGGPGFAVDRILIEPGDGIDLELLGLKQYPLRQKTSEASGIANDAAEKT